MSHTSSLGSHWGKIGIGALLITGLAGGALKLFCPCDSSDSHQTAEVQANVFTSSTQSSASLDANTRGQVIMTWDSRRQEGGTYGVYARAFNAKGEALSHEVHVNQTVHNMQRKPVVTLTGAGEAWFAWESFGQDGSSGSVVARRFDTNLNPLGGEIAVNEQRDFDQVEPVIAANSQGDVVVAWTTMTAEHGTRIHSRCISGEGQPEVSLSDDHDGVDSLPAIASRGDGSFVVVWARAHSESVQPGIYGRFLNADGHPTGEEFLLSEHAKAIEPGVACDATGRFAVTWMQLAESGYEVRVRRFDSSAQPLAASQVVASPKDGWQSGAAIAMAADGRFVVTCNQDDPSDRQPDVYAHFFNKKGRFQETKRINQLADGFQSSSIATGAKRVAWTAENALAFAWNGDAGLGDSSAANLTLFFPETLDVAQAPELGTPQNAPGTSSEEFLQAIPPIWNPNYVPQEPLARQAGTSGDFGFEAVPGTGWTPPDPEAAVGPTRLMVMTNGRIACFDKNGSQQWFDQIENSFGFWGSLGADNFVFDPEVTWDPHSRRFLAMACERSDNFRSYFLFAISKDDTPDNASDWWKYRLDVTAIAGNDIDSPNMSCNNESVLLTADFFGPDKYLIYIIETASVLSGGTPNVVTELITGTSQQSMGIPVVYDNDPNLYILQSTENTTNTSVILHAIRDPFTSYNRVTSTISVDAYTYPNQPPQLGSSSRPFLFEPRFWSVAQRNGAIWAVHHVNSSKARVRWYEIGLNGWPGGGTPSVDQSGEINLGGQIHTYFPSIHVDGADNAAITFARSAPNEYISMGRAVRGAGDPPNEFRPPQVVKTSNNAHTSGRWGGLQRHSSGTGREWRVLGSSRIHERQHRFLAYVDGEV